MEILFELLTSSQIGSTNDRGNHMQMIRTHMLVYVSFSKKEGIA